MVLYYWWRDPSAEEVLWPISIMNMHWFLKGTQLGMIGGFAGGLLVGMSKRGCTYQSVMHDITRYLKFGAKLGLPYAAVRNITDNAQVNLDVLKERAFDVEKSTWHNRLDAIMIAGAIGGRIFFNEPRIWTNLLGMSKRQVVPHAGTVWGAFAGVCFDLPLCIFWPVYVSQSEDVDVIVKHVTNKD
ncbi:unnamed protein product [Amoebophrya sp. A120]|nr:unnamed protein product [Amoebophrya sp. A120]|eukprot:GSA120T00003018001.1